MRLSCSLTTSLLTVMVDNVMNDNVMNDNVPEQASAGAVPSLTGSTGFLLAFTAAAAERRYVQALTAVGLNPIHVGVLEILRAGPRKQARLSEYLQVFQPVMVRVINELEAQQLVERRPHPTDRRAVEVHLLRAGELRLQAAGRAGAQATEQVFGVLTEAQRGELHSLLLVIAEPFQRDEGGRG
jgi:MarR family transcriptional regulator, lower aerobic nicotinate degradation pathway regulator